MKRTSYQERNEIARELYNAFAKDLAFLSHRIDETIGLQATNPEVRDSLRRIRSEIGNLILKSSRLRDEESELSTREFEVLQALATGSSSKEIAENLFLSQATIKTHTASLYRKLGVANKVEAIECAKKLGLLP